MTAVQNFPVLSWNYRVQQSAEKEAQRRTGIWKGLLLLWIRILILHFFLLIGQRPGKGDLNCCHISPADRQEMIPARIRQVPGL